MEQRIKKLKRPAKVVKPKQQKPISDQVTEEISFIMAAQEEEPPKVEIPELPKVLEYDNKKLLDEIFASKVETLSDAREVFRGGAKCKDKEKAWEILIENADSDICAINRSKCVLVPSDDPGPFYDKNIIKQQLQRDEFPENLKYLFLRNYRMSRNEVSAEMIKYEFNPFRSTESLNKFLSVCPRFFTEYDLEIFLRPPYKPSQYKKSGELLYEDEGIFGGVVSWFREQAKNLGQGCFGFVTKKNNNPATCQCQARELPAASLFEGGYARDLLDTPTFRDGIVKEHMY